MKESISCRPSVVNRPSTRVHKAATPSSFSFVRSSRATAFLSGAKKKKETPGHSRVKLPKRIDRFVVRAAFGVQGSFTGASSSQKGGLTFRNSSSNAATKLLPLRSTTNWALSATSMHQIVTIMVKEADYSFQIS